MGLFDKLRGSKPQEEPWRPPLPGMCSCPAHIDTMDLTIEVDPPVHVKTLVADEAITVTLADEHYVYGSTTGERRGPYQWRLTYTPEVKKLYNTDAPAAMDDMLFIQEGIDNVLRLDDHTMAVGSAGLCERGIAGAFATALANPRVRGTES